jgi:hypothetical protein
MTRTTISIFEMNAASADSSRLWQKMCIRESCGYVPAVKRANSEGNIGWAASVPVGGITGITAKFVYAVPSVMYKFDPQDATKLKNWTSFEGAGLSSVKYFARNGSNYLLTAAYWDGSSTQTQSSLYEVHPATLAARVAPQLKSTIPTSGAYAWEVCAIHQGQSSEDHYVVANFVGNSKVTQLCMLVAASTDSLFVHFLVLFSYPEVRVSSMQTSECLKYHVQSSRHSTLITCACSASDNRFMHGIQRGLL